MKTCNRKILELFYNAKHTGRISKPDAVGRVGEDDEGLVIEISWRVVDGIIEDAKFRAFANPNAIAITSLMVDNIIGKSVEDALGLGESVIIDNLGEFLPEYLEVYDMVRECINEAYNNYLKRQNRSASVETQQLDYNENIENQDIDEDDEFDYLKVQTQIEVSEKRGRGRPRKPVDPNAVVEVGEKRGRGRPRKEVDPNAIVEIGEKRGRGRPRKEVDPNAVAEVGEKRGRGRPRKEVDPNAIVEIGEKRGRGRPRKPVDPDAVVEVGEKRGRGRPRKEVDPNAIVEIGEKRGRGRPRKVVDETEVVEIGEKRGRGRPRKEVDPNTVTEVGEKRGRGRPKKEIKYNFPTDLDEVVEDEEFKQLIGEETPKTQSQYSEVNSNTDNEEYDDYDLFKSNIRSILSGKEVSSRSYTNTTLATNISSDIAKEQPNTNETSDEATEIIDETTYSAFDDNDEVVEMTKRGRGRPRKEVDTDVVVEVGEKRGRGRPRKIVDETVVADDGEKRGRGRPKKIVIEQVEVKREERPATPTVNSLTRSLSPTSMSAHGTQDIVFASKNVTTTNININVTKTSSSVDGGVVNNDYSNTTITSTKHKVELAQDDDEIDVDYIKDMQQSNVSDVAQEDELDNSTDSINDIKLDSPANTFAYVDDDYDADDEDDEDEDDDYDDEIVEDKAPSGIADLLKALLDD